MATSRERHASDMKALRDRPSELPDDAAWDSFVASHGHLLQTSMWSGLKSRFGWGFERAAITRGESIVAGAQILFRSLPFGFTLAYVPKGPIVDWKDEEAAHELLGAIRRVAKRRRAFCLTIEPDSLDSPELAARLQRLGLRPTPHHVQPRTSIAIDLDRREEDILAGAKPKTRYNVRLAARKGVLVREGTAADLPAFAALMMETSQRNAFSVHSLQYYAAAYESIVSSGYGRLLLATYEDAILAGIMAFTFGGCAFYMYGASSDQRRDLMPNYLLQWEAMRWAKGRGCHTYDLWGIPDEVGQHPERYAGTVTQRRDGLWGVYRFKQGFGGDVVRYVGAYDDVYSRPAYWLYRRAIPLLARGLGETWHRRFRSG